MSKYIQHLISEGEHQQLDFKFEISDARKIARTLVAFSNSSGGKLLIGVKDNGKIAGIRSEEEIYMLDSAANFYCKPEVTFCFRKWVIDGKTILEADIPEGTDKPYLCKMEDNKWMAFIRVKDENFLADIVQVKAWKIKKRRSGVLLRYTDNEQAVLDFLNINPLATLDYLIQKTGLKKRTLIDILAKLVSFNVICIDQSEKGTSYHLSNP